MLIITGYLHQKFTLHPQVIKELLENNWEYYLPYTTHKAKYESDYWNYIDNRYEKMLYEAAVNADFSDEKSKHIYLFYGDEAKEYSYQSVLRANLFARLDHPELELMNMNYSQGYLTSLTKGYIYASISYYSHSYDKYLTKLDEVNSEIKDLVEQVNNTENIIKKHSLIFNWITSNVKYLLSKKEFGCIDFADDKYIIAHMQTAPTQNLYGAIVNKAAICDGIADAYKYICNMCNLECITVHGYISEMTDQNYHAWNLVKVEDTWYLVDATWNLQKDSPYYFLVKDLHKGKRTPLNIGHDLPGYTDIASNQITFEQTGESTSITSKNGIVFDVIGENYSIYATNNTITTALSSSAFEKYLDQMVQFPKEVLIKTNARVSSIRYYDNNYSLFKIAKGLNSSEILFPYDIDNTHISYMDVYLEFHGNTYRLSFYRGGA